VLIATQVASVNTFEFPETVKPVALSANVAAHGLELTLPSKSVAVVVIK
jgi:hypothetical protein